MARFGQILRCDPQRLGGGDQIWLVRAQKIEHCAEQCTIADPDPQRIGGEASQRQQALRPVVVRQHPDKRPQGKGLRVGEGI